MESLSHIDKQFGLRLRGMREDRGLTQSDVVKRLIDAGVGYMNTSTLSRIELSTRPVRLSEAIAFARIYDVPMNSLVETSQNFSAIDLVARRHNEARSDFVRFRDSVVQMARTQHKLAGMIPVLDEVLGAEGLSDELRDEVEALKRNVVALVELQLIVEARDLVEQTKTRILIGEASSAGRFVNSRDSRG